MNGSFSKEKEASHVARLRPISPSPSASGLLGKAEVLWFGWFGARGGGMASMFEHIGGRTLAAAVGLVACGHCGTSVADDRGAQPDGAPGDVEVGVESGQDVGSGGSGGGATDAAADVPGPEHDAMPPVDDGATTDQGAADAKTVACVDDGGR